MYDIFMPEMLSRHTIRLPFYDYSQAGTYFVTLTTCHRQPIFGNLINGKIDLSKAGLIVKKEWLSLPQHFPNIQVDRYIIMPDHFHGIIIIVKGQTFEGSKTQKNGPHAGSLGVIVGLFKSRVTRMIWKESTMSGIKVWQRNYYEHIIRDDEDYRRIWEYIEANPEADL